MLELGDAPWRSVDDDARGTDGQPERLHARRLDRFCARDRDRHRCVVPDDHASVERDRIRAGAIDVSNPRLYLQVLRALGFASFVNLRPVDTTRRGTPSDLSSVAWDDPEMLERWDAALDSLIVLASENPQIAIAIGNEVDGYFSSHPSEFPAFVRFYRHSLARLHAALPGVPVGVVTGHPWES